MVKTITAGGEIIMAQSNQKNKQQSRQRTQSQTNNCRTSSNHNMELGEELSTNSTNRSRQTQPRRQVRSNRSRNSK